MKCRTQLKKYLYLNILNIGFNEIIIFYIKMNKKKPNDHIISLFSCEKKKLKKKN